MKFSAGIMTLLTTLVFSSCAPVQHAPQRGIQERAAPHYVQWLESQACLREAPRLTAIVSGTSLNWLRSGSGLSGKALAWAVASPSAFPEHRNAFFTALGNAEFLSQLSDLGVEGIFLEDAAEKGSLLSRAISEDDSEAKAVSLKFGPHAGTEQEYERLLSEARGKTLALGGELLPSATGMGADFVLSTLGVRDYPGMYVMTEIPSDLWSKIPSPDKEISMVPADLTELLAENGIIPKKMRQDGSPVTGTASGWAVTGIRQGIDGVARRWIFRWHGKPGFPVLNWQDPSAAARRVMEASLIRQAGLRHQSLVGMRAGAWLGMTAGSDEIPLSGIEPAFSAIRDLSASARRYGAEFLLEDYIPAKFLPAIASGNAGFTRNSYACPALEISIMLQNAAPLRNMLQKALDANADLGRLWNASSDIFPFPAQFFDLPDARKLSPDLVSAIRPGDEGDSRAILELKQGVPSSDAKTMRNVLELQKAVLACLPGLLLLGRDDVMPRLASYREGESIPAPLFSQTDLFNYQHTLKKLIRLRAILGIPRGRLESLPAASSQSILNMLFTFPEGKQLLFTGNFSSRHASFIQAEELKRRRWRDAFTGAAASTGSSLGPWEWKLAVFP